MKYVISSLVWFILVSLGISISVLAGNAFQSHDLAIIVKFVCGFISGAFATMIALFVYFFLDN